MMASIGALTVKYSARRTHAPIRRNSKPVGKCEQSFWSRIDRKQVWQIVDAAEIYDNEHKNPGDRKGPLGPIAIKVLKAMARMVDFRTGRLDPSYETLMAYANCSRDSVNKALDALRRHGFVDWLRRFVPADDTRGEKGPQVKQASNAYRLSLPARAKALLARIKRPPAPLPLDEEQRQANKNRLNVEDTGMAGKTDEELEVLKHSPHGPTAASARTEIRLRNMRKKRESDYQPESTPSLIYYRQ